MSEESQYKGNIAIIGMAGRFPKAKDTDEFWRNLCAGDEAISFFSRIAPDRNGSTGDSDHSSYVGARGILENAALFDAEFFGVKPREAEIMDPQHRVFLECAWSALENAGYDAMRFDGAIGVFAGMSMNTYLANNLAAYPELIGLVGDYQAMLGNDKDFLPTRVSYKLGLTGPSLNIQTACSTSLVATCVACQHLLSFQCDLALAGAVSIRFPQRQAYRHQAGGIASPDGHCRPFDAQAAGTVPGEGAGIVVLRRCEDALADGDYIYAIIKGFAVNNDGSNKVGFTAPGVGGQAEVIAQAQAMAQFEPDTIGYVEAHGTGTPLGDPIEVEALTRAFGDRTNRSRFCALGSVKSNIGHLDTAAGVAGLIKTALALHHRKIPATLHFRSPNPEIDFANSPFYVNATLRDWEADSGPRRAGVSSFGIGGTNAHVVLEEASAAVPTGPSRPAHLLTLSAKTDAALDRASVRLGDYLQRNPDVNLADVAYTLQLGRREFGRRRAVVCRTASQAVEVLSTRDPSRMLDGIASECAVVFMFPGQGAQRPDAGRELYATEPGFRETLDSCCEVLAPVLGLDLRRVLFPEPGKRDWAGRMLGQTAITQPALFVVEYALARLWMAWGLRPEAMIGHSIGEFVAACVSGVFTLKDALVLVAERGRLMQRQPPGAMLAVRLPEAELEPLLDGALSLAAVNGRAACVASGPLEAVRALRVALGARGIAQTPLATSHAFHSDMMTPVLAPFERLVRSLELRPPTVPFVSNVTGQWITQDQALNPAYWASHLRKTVRFHEGMGELLRQPERAFLELGPGRTLSNLVRQHPARQVRTLVVPSLPLSLEIAEVEGLTLALGQLWASGIALDWHAFYAHQRRRRVPLPGYAFEPTRYWVEPAQAKGLPGEDTSNRGAKGDLAAELGPEMGAPRLRPNGNGEIREGPANLLSEDLRKLITELSGLGLAGVTETTTFAEMGFESLLLTQVTLAIEKQFGIQVAFRRLLEDLNCLSTLGAYLEGQVPAHGTASAVGDSLRRDASQLRQVQHHGLDAPAPGIEGLQTRKEVFSPPCP